MSLTAAQAARLGAAGLIAYLAANALGGEQGLSAYMALQAKEAALSETHATLLANIASLDDRAGRMRPDSLDLDYLEERARALLNASHPDEVVIALADLSAETAARASLD
jgi:cell division protein FtsB